MWTDGIERSIIERGHEVGLGRLTVRREQLQGPGLLLPRLQVVAEGCPAVLELFVGL